MVEPIFWRQREPEWKPTKHDDMLQAFMLAQLRFSMPVAPMRGIMWGITDELYKPVVLPWYRRQFWFDAGVAGVVGALLGVMFAAYLEF